MEYDRDQADLVQRIDDFEIPPGDLDFEKESPGRLLRYGIPPRPDPGAEPGLYEVWKSFFASAKTFVKADVVPIADKFRTQLRQTSMPTAAAVTSSTRYETSRNWCGAYIEPNNDKVFIDVSGRWIVPPPATPPGTQPPPSGSVVYACSIWVGLDGQRRYLDSSLPQIGTWQAVTLSASGARSVETYAWCQWWARNYSGNQPVQITSVPVRPGDEVICMVRVWGPSVAAVYIKNLTTGRLAHFRIRAPVVNGHSFTISGATAEWIVERPAILHSKEFFNLADYGSVELFQCHAAGANPALPNWPWVVGTDQILEGERLIRMYDVARNPTRTQFISMPRKETDTSACVSYGGFRN